MEPAVEQSVLATPADATSKAFSVPVRVNPRSELAAAAPSAAPLLDTPFNGALQPAEPELPPGVVDQGSLLEQVSLDDSPEELPQEPKKHISRSRLAGLGLLVFGVAAAVLLGIRIELNKSAVQNASLVSPSSRIQSQQLGLPGLSKQLEAAPASGASNGSVTVNGSLVLAPAVQPSSPVAGQLFYNQASNQMQYFDGTGIVALQGGSTTNIYNNTTAGNTFVTNNISNGSSIQGTAGTLAMFGKGGGGLSDSLITQDGVILNVAAAGTNIVNVGSAASGSITVLQGGTGGVSILTGTSSVASGDIILQTGNSSTTGPGDITIDTGEGVINGTVVLDQDFEAGIAGTGSAFGTTLSQTTDRAHGGTHSLKITLTGGDWTVNGSTLPALTAGHTYVYSAWVRAASTTETFKAFVYFPSINQETTNLTITDSSSSWTQITSVFTAPGNLSNGQFTLEEFAGAAGAVHYLDDVTLTDMSDVTGFAVNVGTTNAEMITVGNSNQVGNTTITAGASGVNISDATGGVGVHSGTTVSISASTVTLSGAGGSGGGVIVKPQADSTTAFSVQKASGSTTLLNVDTSGSTVSLGVGSVASFGNTRVGNVGGCCNIGRLQASKFTTVGGGAVSSISAFIGWGGTLAAPNNRFQMAIYADNGSGTAPGAYIASTAVSTLAATTVSSGGLWNTLPITATLSAGTTYWLAYWNNTNLNDSNNAMSYSSPANGALYQSSATWASGPSNGLPTTYPAGALTSGASFSVYASFSQAGPALVLGTGGLVTASGPVLFQDPTNSSTAFQVQDNLGNVILTADTSNSIVKVTSLAISGHIITSGTVPAIAAGAAACTSPTVSISGNDTSGIVSITTGTGCASGGKLATVTFASPFGAAPHVTLTPGSAASASLNAYVDDSTISAAAIDIGTGTTPASATAYQWNYIVVQ